HHSVFLIAHFHNVLIRGVVFGAFSGLIIWFATIFGFNFNERLCTYSFCCWFISFFVGFMPLYILGTIGMTRRLSHYDSASGYQTLFIYTWVVATLIGL
ncbi:cbb3-type cytochrome c oxidase subunit I, partial [Francisella tularensis]|nr:cbb3-type cytochrome c oxidase subunit I [Francisella tularensis]